ncbi:uncharacterized protein LOC129230467 [Uloborus diversus]|uniref:uncharacterized protein LOC129230467 n=1 Tax=Uloborus diversus TaxID=327109 RepID=UPI002409C61C|nr:uncharacterized protein LOC129230467 [Uloborus diversus]
MEPTGSSSPKSKKCSKEKCSSPKKHGQKSPEHSKRSPEHDTKLWQAKEQVFNMPSPSREFRECVVVDDNRSTNTQTICCGPDKKGESFSKMAVLYFMLFSCAFVLAIVGLRMFTIEDKLLRLDTEFQQQQMRIDALEKMVGQLTKTDEEPSDPLGSSRTKRETALCNCPPVRFYNLFGSNTPRTLGFQF